jgi:hypothetical protein
MPRYPYLQIQPAFDQQPISFVHGSNPTKVQPDNSGKVAIAAGETKLVIVAPVMEEIRAVILISFPKQSEWSPVLGLISSLHPGTSIYFN